MNTAKYWYKVTRTHTRSPRPKLWCAQLIYMQRGQNISKKTPDRHTNARHTQGLHTMAHRQTHPLWATLPTMDRALCHLLLEFQIKVINKIHTQTFPLSTECLTDCMSFSLYWLTLYWLTFKHLRLLVLHIMSTLLPAATQFVTQWCPRSLWWHSLKVTSFCVSISRD